MRALRWPVALVLFVSSVAVTAQQPAVGAAGVAAPAVALHGRLEQHGGLTVLRTWGTPQERGYAHGLLLGKDIAASMQTEFAVRFQRRQPLLDQVRKALPRLIEYPEAIGAEIDAVFQGLVDSGAERALDGFDREFDLVDLRIANALDVFGLMGCSGFTLWGNDVEGGGVLTGRNFDWPYTGRHLIDRTIVMVQHADVGRAVASVTWPGYVGTVTGINQDGVAVFLHVGSGQITLAPDPGSWPTAIAAREILARAPLGAGKATLDLAQELLSNTSPPAGFLTRVVLPAAPDAGSPAGLFETDSSKCVRAAVDGPCIVTNHFLSRHDGREAAGDSLQREKQMHEGVEHCLHDGDHRVSIDEAWEMLQQVQRGGGKRFGTLHSLVFRPDPWCFELRLADLDADGKLVAAPVSSKRYALTRAELFPADPAAAPTTEPR